MTNSPLTAGTIRTARTNLQCPPCSGKQPVSTPFPSYGFAASVAWLGLSTASTSILVSGYTEGKGCFYVVLFLFLLL